MIFYTCITNNYCPLPDIVDEGHTYICFTDGTVEPKAPWELRPIKYKCDDPVVLSRHPKIMFHEYFDSPCVWVDAANIGLLLGDYKHEEKDTRLLFEDMSREIFLSDRPFLLSHPDQHNFFEEASEYYLKGWVEQNTILQFAEDLSLERYDFTSRQTMYGCVMWRKPTDDTIKWCELWWRLYQKCGPRDQMSGTAALALSGIKYNMEHPVNVIREFINYWWWWHKDNQVHGAYSRAEAQDSWRVFLNRLSYRIREHWVGNIDLGRLSHMYSGFWRIFQEMEFYLEQEDTTLDGWDGDYLTHKERMTMEKDSQYDFTVYTCITNGYDNIPDHHYDDRVRYVCFHDGTIPTDNPRWDYINIKEFCERNDVEKEAIDCPRRLSSYPKINPHKLFEPGTHTVWIDGCYKMTEEFVKKSKEVFPTTCHTMEHCYEFTYYDEMLEGFMCNFFSWGDGVWLTKSLAEAGYRFDEYISPCCTMIWRTVDDSEQFKKFCDEWWKWSLIGSNRDQVSFDAARQFSGLPVHRIHNKPPETVVMGVELRFTEKNKNRKGKHPKRGEGSQYKGRREFLADLKEHVKMSPLIYAKHEHLHMMDFNGVFENEGDRAVYMNTSPTMRKYQAQCNLWAKKE